MISNRRRPLILRAAPAIGAILLWSLVAALQALATSQGGSASRREPLEPIVGGMEAAAHEREALQQQVIALFYQLDQANRAIEGVREDIASTRGRIAELSGQIDAQQRMLNRQAAVAYMSPPTVQIDALLGTRSLTYFQDAYEFLAAVSRRDQDVILSLTNRKTEFDLHQAQLEGLQTKLHTRRDRLEETAAELVDKLEQQRALVRQLAGEGTQANVLVRTPPPSAPSRPSRPPPGPPPGPEEVRNLIRQDFAPLGARTVGVALCVAEAESDLDPLAVNPVTGASGVFQFMPSTWAILSEMAGWDGASVFDARANAAVAAWTVAHYGWHAWASVAAGCGA